MCPADTPEGDTCGLVKNLALLAHVTRHAGKGNIDDIERISYSLGVWLNFCDIYYFRH